jgi:hypothetical protein
MSILMVGTHLVVHHGLPTEPGTAYRFCPLTEHTTPSPFRLDLITSGIEDDPVSQSAVYDRI